MTEQHAAKRTFRFIQDGAAIAFGLIAAGSTILSAVLIFGPMADRKVLLMSGSATRTEPSVAAASTPFRVASVDRHPD